MERHNKSTKKKKKNRQESRLIRNTSDEGDEIRDNAFDENERTLVARENDIETDSQVDMETKRY